MSVEREGEEVVHSSEPGPVLIVPAQVHQEIRRVQVRSSEIEVIKLLSSVYPEINRAVFYRLSDNT